MISSLSALSHHLRVTGIHNCSWTLTFFWSLCLSWIFALCAQIYLPLPFNIVPIYPHPLPLFLAVLYFRKTGLFAYLLYLAQGAAGLPFFARMNSGIAYLVGPTAGYLWGFLLTMILFDQVLALTFNAHDSKPKLQTKIFTFFIMLMLGTLYFSCGLLGLSFYVPSHFLLPAGLYPFLIGDSIKLLIVWRLWNKYLP